MVEDDEDLALLLAYNLNNRGYGTVTAFTGPDACQRVEAESPDLILLDILLPGMDGWQVCDIIRNHHRESIAEIPIIMLTALGSPEEKLRGIELGADDYIPKPFSIKEVLLKVDRLISRELKRKHLSIEIKRLAEKEAQRNDFQDMLFHELKNQLIIIGGYSERIVKNQDLPLNEYQQCAGIIQKYSHSLNSLAEEVLILSRLEANEYPLPTEEVSLQGIAEYIISVHLPEAEEKGIHIRFEETENVPSIRANATAVKLAISNIIQNAIKYSPEGSGIEVRVNTTNGRRAAIEVEDEGPGIPESDRDQVFNRFYRGERVKNHTKGTGLGLYIAKTLVESMGGAISLEDRAAKGACFSLMFDLSQSREVVRDHGGAALSS